MARGPLAPGNAWLSSTSFATRRQGKQSQNPILRWRQRQAWTQAEMAESIGVPQTTLSCVETGKIRCPLGVMAALGPRLTNNEKDQLMEDWKAWLEAIDAERNKVADLKDSVGKYAVEDLQAVIALATARLSRSKPARAPKEPSQPAKPSLERPKRSMLSTVFALTGD